MIGKSIGLNNRRARRAINRDLRRKGLTAKIVSPEQIRGRAIAITDYIRDADAALMRRLELSSEESHAALAYIADVAATTAELRKVEPGEKVDLIGFRNFRSNSFERCQREMVATMMRSPGIDPLEHYVLAWQAHEQPTPEQVHRAAEGFLEVMGLGENQAIYAAHSNTANYHLHIAANRVHPKTLQRVAAGGDWQVDTIHQAIAKIEHEQGWASEPNAIYRANEHGVFHNATNIQVRNERGPTGSFPDKEQRAAAREKSAAEKEKLPVEEQLSEGALAYERRTQLASFERLAKTVVKPILRTARSWPELHERLAAQGFEYELGGSGARVRWGDRTLAASVADRSASLGQMEKRKGFGTFAARDPSTIVVDRQPSPFGSEMDVSRYWAERQTHAAAVETLRASLRSQRQAVEQNLVAIQDCVAADIKAAGWTNAGIMLNVARGVAGHEHRRLTGMVAEQFRHAASALAALQSFPSLQAWSAGTSPPMLPLSGDVVAPAIMMSTGYGAAPLAVDMPGYRRVAAGRAYHHIGKDGRIAVRDLGDLVLVEQGRNEDAVRLALLLAREKWGVVSIVSGDAAFRTLCTRIAAEEGIRLEGKRGTASEAAAQAATLPKVHVRDNSFYVRHKPTHEKTGTVVEPLLPPQGRESIMDVEASIYGEFPFLHDPPVEQDRTTSRQFIGLNPLVDAWLAAHRRDTQDFARLRPLANRIMQDRDARDIVQQMEAEGVSEAERITQQARYQQRQQAASQQMFMQ